MKSLSELTFLFWAKVFMVSVSQEAALIFNNKQAFQVFLLTEDPTKTDKLKSNQIFKTIML